MGRCATEIAEGSAGCQAKIGSGAVQNGFLREIQAP
jgi:hypothetical protein